MDKDQDRSKRVSSFSWFMWTILFLIIVLCIQAFLRQNEDRIPPLIYCFIPYDLTHYIVLDVKDGLTLLLAWSAAMAARRRFLIGVRPHLIYTSKWKCDGSVEGFANNKRVWVVQVQNVGPGLALPTHITYHINNDPIKDHETVVEVLRKKNCEIDKDYKLLKVSPGTAIGKDKETQFFVGTEDFLKKINMRVNVGYAGILGSSFLIPINCYPQPGERPDIQSNTQSGCQSVERHRTMSELDVAKEQIAYLKLWLGIMVVTDIILIGWFIGNYGQASISLPVADLLATAMVSVGIAWLHCHIKRRIENLRGL